MKRRHLVLMIALAALLAAAVPAAAGEKCSGETQTCLNKLAGELKARGWVGLETEKQDGKLVVTSVEPEGPARLAGIVVGDVLVAMDGVEFNQVNEKALYAVKKNHQVGSTVTYTVARGGCCHKAGKTTDVAVTRGELPEAVLARWVGGHMLDHAMIATAAKY